jgi:hypothetical protein
MPSCAGEDALSLLVMAWHSASEDARERAYLPAIRDLVLLSSKKDVNARAKRGHDGKRKRDLR